MNLYSSLTVRTRNGGLPYLSFQRRHLQTFALLWATELSTEKQNQRSGQCPASKASYKTSVVLIHSLVLIFASGYDGEVIFILVYVDDMVVISSTIILSKRGIRDVLRYFEETD